MALALLAVFFVHRSATVTAIILAAAVVVLVVADAVALVIRASALAGARAVLFFELGIKALALLAVTFFHIRSATVTAIILAAAVVVLVVAVAVALVTRVSARTGARAALFELGIKALALLAVIFFHIRSATVTAIILAAAVVVLVVAVAVALVTRVSARAGARAVLLFELGIKALALFAVTFLHTISTAVTAVISATTIVVDVIAVAVTPEFGKAAFAFTSFRVRGFRSSSSLFWSSLFLEFSWKYSFCF